MAAFEVDFVGEIYEMDEGESLTFGRTAELCIDEDNQYMHRQVGAFVHHQGVWWLRNDGRRIELVLRGESGSQVTLPPASAQAIVNRSGSVRFVAGPTTYELNFAMAADPVLPRSGAPVPVSGENETRDFGVVPLNDEQRLLVVALAEPRLGGDASARLPANADIAHRLGWSLKKFDRKLDYLCRRLDEAGVRGIRGGKGDEALDRRSTLVDHAIRVGMVVPADAELLP